LKEKVLIALRYKPVQFLARLIFGGTFIYASLSKIAFPTAFAEIVNNYGILPSSLSKLAAFSLPWIELILGIFLITGIFIRESAFFLSFLIIIFMAAIIHKALNGTVGDCGCFSIGSLNETQSIVLIITRDVLLLLLGIIVLLSTKFRDLNFKNN